MASLKALANARRNRARGARIRDEQLRRYRISASGCWEFTGKFGADGYGKLKRDGKTVRAHRAFYEALVGPIPRGLLVCHRCDNPKCVNPAHLFCGTVLDNERDKDAKRRRPPPWWVLHPELALRGVKNPASKLTLAQVAEIRRPGAGTNELARKFGVNRTTIQRVRSGKNWRSP